MDPLEFLFVREVMRTKVVVLSAASTGGEMQQSLRPDHRQSQRLLPVVDEDGRFVGVLTRGDIRERMKAEGETALGRCLGELVRPDAVEAYPDEPLRVVVYRMAEKGLTRMPVLERGTERFLGLVALDDLLKACGRNLEEERTRERPLKLRFLSPGSRTLATIQTESPAMSFGANPLILRQGAMHDVRMTEAVY